VLRTPPTNTSRALAVVCGVGLVALSLALWSYGYSLLSMLFAVGLPTLIGAFALVAARKPTSEHAEAIASAHLLDNTMGDAPSAGDSGGD
jgi:hypothetical protein